MLGTRTVVDLALGIVLAAATIAPALAANGDLDLTFGGTGKVTTPIGAGSDAAYSVALQADGKIVAAGNSVNGSSYSYVFAVARYNSDGTLDATFGGTGKVTTPIGPSYPSYDAALSVALQADGKIVAAGYSDNGSNNDFAVVRYNSDGTLDTTFGGTGKVTTPVGASYEQALSVALQADGKIVAAGSSDNGSNEDFAVVRYNSDGTLDTTFGGTGKVTTPIGASEEEDIAYSVALQADGKIVAAGSSYDDTNGDFAVVRYNADGTLDAALGGTGKVTTSIGFSSDFAASVALQADGKIVAAGFSDNGPNEDFAVVRYEGGPCGNGTLEVGEDCDDGSIQDGDCCSSTCLYDPPSTPCPDGDLCNGDESCDGVGGCQAGSPLDCADSDLCTRDSCDPIDGCQNPAEPATTCLDTWAKGSLLVKENVAGKEKLIAKLTNGPALAQSDFGNPLLPGGTAYTVCVYDDDDSLAGKIEVDRAAMQCAGSDCWRPLGPIGYRYKDRNASADGAKSVKLLGGDAQKSKIRIKAANNSSKGQTSLPTGIAAALSGSSSATVQVFGSDAPQCLSAALGTVVKDDGDFFKAK